MEDKMQRIINLKALKCDMLERYIYLSKELSKQEQEIIKVNQEILKLSEEIEEDKDKTFAFEGSAIND